MKSFFTMIRSASLLVILMLGISTLGNGQTATITSNLPDYAPQSLATFYGSGFQPFENIILKVKNLNHPCHTVETDSSYMPWTVEADAAGNFETWWTVCDCVGDSLKLKATGQVSGNIAYVLFSDALADFYRSKQSGDWNDVNTWESSALVGGPYVAATVPPTNGSNTITIQNTHVVTATAASTGITVDQVVINAGGQLTINSGVTINLGNGSGTDLTVNGTAAINGTLAQASSGATIVNGTLSIGSGALFSGGGGNGSTAGSFTVASTGNLTVDGSLSGVSTVGMVMTINGVATLNGSVGGSSSDLSIGSTANISITGTVAMASVSLINIASGALVSISGTGVLSGQRGNGGNVISNSGTVTLTGTATISGLNVGGIIINSGGVIEFGPSTKATGNVFTLAAGGTIKIGSPDGVVSSGAFGNVQTTTRTLNAGGHYVYNGVANQNIGSAFPTGNLQGSLTIDNPGNIVTLDVARTIGTGGIVNLKNGTFATGTNLTMGGSSIINRIEGSLTGTLNTSGQYTVNYSGTSKTTGAELSGPLLSSLSVAVNAGQTVTLDQTRLLTGGDLTISSGTLDIGSFTLNRNNNNGNLNISNGASLRIGGTGTLPAPYASHSLGATSTIEYYGTNQSIAALNSSQIYGNLILSGSGIKTPPAALSVATALTVNPSATLEKIGAFNLTIGTGGLTNNGTITLNGTTAACGEADNVVIRSSSNGSQRSWSGSGTFNITDADIQDQAGSASITALSSTSSGNNGANWNITSSCVLCSNTTSEETVVACESYTWACNGQTYTTSGDKTCVTPIPGSGGCTNTATLHLTINHNTTSEETVVACESYTWSCNAETYTTSGDKTCVTPIPGSGGCTNTATLHLTINHNTTSEETVVACETYTWACNGQTYTTSGDKTCVTPIPGSGGCTNTATLHLTINHNTTSEETVVACESYTWACNGETYATSGDKTCVTPIPGSGGCTNTATLHLTINHNTTSEETVVACESYTWACNGETYTTSGDKTCVTPIPGSGGCTNTATLHLTINHNTTSEETVVACETYTWACNGQTYTTSGDKTCVTPIPGSGGCTNTATLHLTINHNTTSEETVVACESYTWACNGETYTTSGDKTCVTPIPGSGGCTNTATLHLTINQNTTSEETVVACESYTWACNGETYTTSGDKTCVTPIPGSGGCTNTATLHLTINHNTTSEETVVACESYTWACNGETYTTSGDKTCVTPIPGSGGCTNTATLHLTINHNTTSEETVVACESYTWSCNAETYTTSGDKTCVTPIPGSGGCTNTATLHLTINHNTTSEETVVACESYTWDCNGETYTTSGDKTCVTPIPGSGGCTNTTTLHLTINHNTTSEETVVACESYTWACNGETYTTSGDKTCVTPIPGSGGCTNTATLHLTINHNTTSEETVVACESYTWACNGETYTTSGDKTCVTPIPGSGGCTNTATLHLTINHNTTSEETVIACESYTWACNAETYTTSGDKTCVTPIPGSGGCTNTATLHLTINHNTTSEETVVACESYTWSCNAETYTTSGDKTCVTPIPGSGGCTNTATLHLTINHNTTSEQTVVACESYTWACNGQTYTTLGDKTCVTSIPGSGGCTNTATLHLTINHNTTSEQTVVACESYTWACNGQTYTTSGDKTCVTSIPGSGGCTNTATLHLTINHNTTSEQTVTACGSYTWSCNGMTYNTPGDKTCVTSIPGSGGCTNTATLHLSLSGCTVNLSANCTTTNAELYFGYSGDQSAVITAKPVGGTAPYTVVFTMSRPLKCNQVNNAGDELWVAGANTASSVNNVCPGSGSLALAPVSTSNNSINTTTGYSVTVTLMASATITATITDANGNVATCSKNIYAEDARCFAGNSGNVKVKICHKTGSANNPCVELCVDMAAVQTHLDHGDFLGKCTPNCVAPIATGTKVATITPDETVVVPGLKAIVSPNPSENFFTLRLQSNSLEPVQVRLYDVSGKQVYAVSGSVYQAYQFGQSLTNGIYLVEVRQGDQRITSKLIKQ